MKTYVEKNQPFVTFYYGTHVNTTPKVQKFTVLLGL